MLLYKYMGRDDFFDEFMLRFTPPNELNDPLECRPIVKIRDPEKYIDAIFARNLQTIIKRYTKPGDSPAKAIQIAKDARQKLHEDYWKNPEEWERKGFDAIMNVTNRNIGVLSLTEDKKNQLMWAHYANSHRGFVIGIEDTDPLLTPNVNDVRLCGKLRPVKYSNSIPIVEYDPGNVQLHIDVFYTKREDWSYEKEYRIIRMLDTADYIKENKYHLFKIQPQNVKEVIFGCNVEAEVVRAIKEKSLSKNPNIFLYKMAYNQSGEFIINIG